MAVAGSTDLDRLEQRLGYRFSDRSVLVRALTHSSFSGAPGRGPADDYERLEFLGDTLLGFIVSEWLWRDDPEAPEGILSRRKQTVVRASTLARVARQLEVGEAMRLGHGEQLTGGRNKPSLLADSFEALLGAVYIDGGLRQARAFVRRHLGEQLRATRGTRWVPEDSKTRLQEAIQARLKRTPVYRVIGESGPPHRPQFEAAVFVGRKRLASGKGSSRKEAEQRAAREALLRLEAEE